MLQGSITLNILDSYFILFRPKGKVTAENIEHGDFLEDALLICPMESIKSETISRNFFIRKDKTECKKNKIEK